MKKSLLTLLAMAAFSTTRWLLISSRHWSTAPVASSTNPSTKRLSRVPRSSRRKPASTSATSNPLAIRRASRPSATSRPRLQPGCCRILRLDVRHGKGAAEFPDTKFVIVDSVVKLPNVRSVVYKENEGSYLVGLLAGLASKSGKVGFVGGMDIR